MTNNVISVKLTNGETLKRDYSDYYIQDGILTVHRDEKLTIDRTTYYPFKLHVPLANILSLEEVRK